jgi:hypothetical protein
VLGRFGHWLAEVPWPAADPTLLAQEISLPVQVNGKKPKFLSPMTLTRKRFAKRLAQDGVHAPWKAVAEEVHFVPKRIVNVVVSNRQSAGRQSARVLLPIADLDCPFRHDGFWWRCHLPSPVDPAAMPAGFGLDSPPAAELQSIAVDEIPQRLGHYVRNELIFG